MCTFSIFRFNIRRMCTYPVHKAFYKVNSMPKYFNLLNYAMR